MNDAKLLDMAGDVAKLGQIVIEADRAQELMDMLAQAASFSRHVAHKIQCERWAPVSEVLQIAVGRFLCVNGRGEVAMCNFAYGRWWKDDEHEFADVTHYRRLELP